MLPTFLTNFAAACTPTTSFFGLTEWYRYLDSETDALGKCVPTIDGFNDFWLIGLAVIDSLLKIAGMVAIGYVIYGGIQFVLSQGQPDKVKSARETILNAVIGLAIALVAVSVVSYIGNTLK